MKIKVIKSFNDKENDFVTRKAGEVLDVIEKRGIELVSKGFATVVETKKSTAKTE